MSTSRKFKTFGKFLTKYIIGEQVWVNGKQVIFNGDSIYRCQLPESSKLSGSFYPPGNYLSHLEQIYAIGIAMI
jgi:hypothetical protein